MVTALGSPAGGGMDGFFAAGVAVESAAWRALEAMRRWKAANVMEGQRIRTNQRSPT
jgi:hypothetical protein